MCIRDRDIIWERQRLYDVQRAVRDAQFMVPTHKLLRLAQVCLLYTSDAADERSSVDLGGRRIIKKKTSTHQWRLPRTRITNVYNSTE